MPWKDIVWNYEEDGNVSISRKTACRSGMSNTS